MISAAYSNIFQEQAGEYKEPQAGDWKRTSFNPGEGRLFAGVLFLQV